jgi:hypothetical protein
MQQTKPTHQCMHVLVINLPGSYIVLPDLAQDRKGINTVLIASGAQ